MQQLKLFQEHLPQKARSCDKYEVDNKVRYITEAIKKRYIQPNDFNSVQWLVFDIDRKVSPDCIRNDNLAPEPTIFVSNPKNGHAHLFYLLKTAVHKNSNSSQKAIQFAAAVEYGLAIKLKADPEYIGLLAKNALHADWKVLHTVPQAYDLEELAESVDTSLLNTPLQERLEYGLSRNCSMFEEVSRWAYKAIRQGWPDYNQWHKAVLTRTEMLNRQLKKPMDYAEYKHIAKSIAKWTHAKFSKQGFAEWQSNNGKRSGEARAKKNEDKRIQAHQMRSNGLTQQAIAKELGVSQSAIAKWLKK